MGVKKIVVLHKRDQCIGCGSCVLLDDTNRYMSKEDGKACLIGAEQKGDTYFVGRVDEDMIKNTVSAQNACPMQIITVNTK